MNPWLAVQSNILLHIFAQRGTLLEKEIEQIKHNHNALSFNYLWRKQAQNLCIGA